MYTDKLYTGQREIMGLGIYHYNARFYSPKLGRFLSADTIVPGFANPQNLNRYSYVGNSPLNYTDPSGHMRLAEGPQQDRFSQSVADKYVPKPTKRNKDRGSGAEQPRLKPAANWNPPLYGDADFYSFSVSIGAGPWFFTASTDFVVNAYEVEGFLSYGLGPGLGGDKLPGFQGLNDFGSALMTPQVSGTFWRGVIWGDAIAADARNYRGTAFQTGGSLGPGSVEYFSSVAQDGPLNGMMDRQVEGVAVGISGGPLPIPGEVHANYANAIPVKEFTNLAKAFCGAFGCGRLRP